MNQPLPPVFEVIGLSKSFGGLRVTNDVSLALTPGDRVALIGPNGAGKTTFVNLVTGSLAPDKGVVRLAGQEVNGIGPSVVCGGDWCARSRSPACFWT